MKHSVRLSNCIRLIISHSIPPEWEKSSVHKRKVRGIAKSINFQNIMYCAITVIMLESWVHKLDVWEGKSFRAAEAEFHLKLYEGPCLTYYFEVSHA